MATKRASASPKSNDRSPRKRLAPEERRLQLLDVAERLLIDHGSATLTLEGLAAEAGVTQPLLYHYFDGREALLQALILRAYERFDAEVGELVGAQDAFVGKLRVLAGQAIDPLPAGRLVDLVQEAMSRPEPAKHAFQGQAVTTTIFVASLLQAEYGFEQAFATVVAGTALASTQGFEVASRFTSWDTDEATDVLVELMLGLFERAASMPQARGAKPRTKTRTS